MHNIHSCFDELLKIAAGVAAPNPARRDEPSPAPSEANELVRLLRIQKKMAPLEGSNLPGRLRYLKAKAEGKVDKDEPVQQPLAPSFNKQSSVAMDQRRLGLGGVPRPPFPTAESVRPLAKGLREAQSVGQFNDRTTKKMLKKPGPTIGQVAPTIGLYGKIRTPAM